MTKATFDTWLRRARLITYIPPNQFTIQVEDQFSYEWLTMRLRPVIIQTLKSIIQRPPELIFTVKPT